MHSIPQTIPWYKQFWPWLVIALPLSTMIAGITTVYIAAIKQDSLVQDDWYKEGKAINQQLDKTLTAKSLGLKFGLNVDPHTGEVFAKLISYNHTEMSGEKPLSQLILKLVHPTLAEYDQIITLNASAQDGHYLGDLNHQVEGKYHLYLSDPQQQWRLKSTVEFPITGEIILQPPALNAGIK